MREINKILCSCGGTVSKVNITEEEINKNAEGE